jgi:hypothetical protein
LSLLAAAAPALANDPLGSEETRVPRMARFLEWVPNGQEGLYIRAESGRWYYARTESECPRLRAGVPIRFELTGSGDLDRFGAIRADGWRCQLSSVVASDAPPQRSGH